MATSMTRFLRKYNKRLLAIFGVGLMIVFLLPSTINQMSRSNPAEEVIGQAYGEKVRIGDINVTEMETSLLDGLNRIYLGANPSQQQQQQVPFNWHAFVAYSKQPELDYYLLVQEAQNMGITVSPEQADTMLRESKIPPEIINSMIQQQNIPLNNLRRAVANYLSVVNMLQVVSSSTKISDKEMQSLFKLISDTMTANILPFAAKSFVDKVPAPTDQQLADYFKANQEKFRYPDRVQVEYIGADVDQIKDQIKIDPERAQQYVNANPSEFMTTTQPTTKPGEKSPATATAPVQVPMEAKQALAMATDKLKTQRARKLVNDAVNEALNASKKFWNTAAIDDKGIYKQKPATVSDYQKLTEEISKKYQIKLTYQRTALISQKEANTTPGIGMALVIEQQRPLYFGEYAFKVIPLVEAPKDKFANASRILIPFQDSDPLRVQRYYGADIQGYYFFRVIATDKSHLPATLDEVKADVVKAWKLEQAYKLAQAEAQKTLALANKQKLDELAKSNKDKEFKKLLDQLKVTALEPQTFARRSLSRTAEPSAPTIPTVTGNTEKFADDAFDKLWNQPSTQPSGEFTSIVIPDDADQTTYVVQLVNKTPVTIERYKQVQGYFLQYLNRSQQQEFLQNWLTPENLHKRANFQSRLVQEEEQG